MTEYKLVATDDHVAFMRSINLYLKDGWKLQGGVATMERHYVQAITKETEEIK